MRRPVRPAERPPRAAPGAALAGEAQVSYWHIFGMDVAKIGYQAQVIPTLAVTYVLTVAEIQGVHVVDTERRRALVLSALLGKEGSEAVQGQLGLSSMFWAAQLLMQMPLPSVKSINAHLIKRVAKRSAASLREGADDYVATSLDELARLISDVSRRTEAGRRAIAERRGVDVTDVDLSDE